MTDPTPPAAFADARTEALEDAADRARLAPSVHNTQPWRLVLSGDHLALRADRGRQLTVMDPHGRELVLSVGAALLNARAGLAARGWAADVRRLPDPADPDLLAEVRPVPGRPDSDLAALDPLIPRRHTNRRRFGHDPLPEHLLARLSRIAAEEASVLVLVHSDDDRRLVARLTRQADRLQSADHAYRTELRHWTTRPAGAGDGVPADAVARADDSLQPDELPLRNFDTTGAGELPAETSSDRSQTLLVLATATDDAHAWLRAGEAMQRLLLELTRLGWAASPITQAMEIPATRARLRAAVTGQAHPQMLLRAGHAAPTPTVPRRPRDEAVTGSVRPSEPLYARTRPRPAGEPPSPAVPGPHRPVSDGRGGTTWA